MFKSKKKCSFGMLVSKFRVSEEPLGCKIKTCESIIKVSCVLHNFIRLREGVFSTPSYPYSINFIRIEDAQEQQNIVAPRASRVAENNREFLCNYFMSYEGQVP